MELLSHLPAKDLACIADVLAYSLPGHLSKGEKAYLALRRVGKPAHFSEVCSVYNSMFADDPPTEHNVLAVLDRGKHGIVWIGIKGTYALQEWGYERPSMGLHKAVAEIVRDRYRETGQPVPLGVITTELGKYRRIVSPPNVPLAAGMNPELRRLYGDVFAPIDASDTIRDESDADELDRVLREFGQTRS